MEEEGEEFIEGEYLEIFFRFGEFGVQGGYQVDGLDYDSD